MKVGLRLRYYLTVDFTPEDFTRLQAITTKKGFLLKQDVRIDAVVLRLTPDYADIQYWYWGTKPNGVEHQRRTEGHVRFSLGEDAGKVWLDHLFGADTNRGREINALAAFWPVDPKDNA